MGVFIYMLPWNYRFIHSIVSEETTLIMALLYGMILFPSIHR